MATTDREFAILALAACNDSPLRFALIHGANELRSGVELSDLDLVVAEPPAEVLPLIEPGLAERDLQAVVESAYDIGGAETIFLMTPSAEEGVQLDLLYDPLGLGRYGITSQRLLEWTEEGQYCPVVTEPASLVYLWRKRVRKHQRDRLSSLRARAAALDPRLLIDASIALTGDSRAAGELLGRLGTRRTGLMSPTRGSMHIQRLGRRVAKPVGFWAHIEASDDRVARQAAGRFGGVLPRVEVCEFERSAVLSLPWYWTTVQPVRLRAGLIVTWGGPIEDTWPKPDLVLGAAPLDATCVALVNAMAARIPA